MADSKFTVPAEEAAPNTSEPSDFPMSLREFAVTLKLDPLYEAGLSTTCLPFDRTLAEWNEALEALKSRPVRNA